MDNSMANGIIDWCISVVKGKTEAEEKRDLYKSIREDLVLFSTLNDASFFTLNDANAA